MSVKQNSQLMSPEAEGSSEGSTPEAEGSSKGSTPEEKLREMLEQMAQEHISKLNHKNLLYVEKPPLNVILNGFYSIRSNNPQRYQELKSVFIPYCKDALEGKYGFPGMQYAQQIMEAFRNVDLANPY